MFLWEAAFLLLGECWHFAYFKCVSVPSCRLPGLIETSHFGIKGVVSRYNLKNNTKSGNSLNVKGRYSLTEERTAVISKEINLLSLFSHFNGRIRWLHCRMLEQPK